MKRSLVAALILVSGALAIGCGKDNMGQSDADIAKQSQNWKQYDQEKMKENPPPPGEGPSN